MAKAPTPAKKPVTRGAESVRDEYTLKWRKKDPEQVAVAYRNYRNSLASQFRDDPKKQEKALARFDADPRIQAMRQVAGLAPVSTRNAEVRKIGEKARSEAITRTGREAGLKARRSAAGDVGSAIKAGIARAPFGIPERLAAAGQYYTGNSGNLNYDETLQAVRASTDAQLEGSTIGNFFGQLLGGGAAGSAATTGALQIGGKLATVGAPAAAKTGRAIQSLFTLKRGSTAKNAAKIVTQGAGFGAVQAGGEGKDVVRGAGEGAAAAVVLGGGIKGAEVLGRKAGEVLRLSGADTIFRNYTNTTREALQKRLTDFRKRTGSEPTLYELLDLEDRNSLQKVFGRLDRGQQDRAAGLARDRVQAIPGEVAQVARNATRGQRKQNISTLASALPESRGAPATAATTDEARLAVGAADNPTRLAQLRREETRNIMAPYDERVAVDEVRDLIPTEPRALDPDRPGEISEVEIDPEMSSVIRSAMGIARIRPEGVGITVRELTDVLSTLREAAGGKGSMIERGAAQRAADHIEGVIAQRHPDVAPAIARMNEAWASRSRQIEGMLSTRPQADVNPLTPRNLQKSENIYETPEGGVGRAMGQRTALLDDLGAANAPALGTVRTLAESETAGREIAQNIGVPATREITDAARAQSESARRLVTAVRDPKFDVSEIESGDLALLAAGLNPASMAYTKARALSVMLDRFGKSISQSKSRTIVDMLFSRDPAMTQRAINALRSETQGGREVLRDIINAASIAFSGETQQGSNPDDPALLPEDPVAADPAAEADYAAMSDEELLAAVQAEEAEGGEKADYSAMSDEELLAALEAEKSQAPYGRRVVEEVFPGVEVTEDLRDPNSELGRKNRGSKHNTTDGAVDVRPIPGLSFEEFIETLKAEGHNVIEARDEVKNPSGHATGPHWHVVIG